MKKRILSMLCCLLLLSILPLCAFAHEVPDYDRTGSISLTMSYKGDAVAGGTLTLYRVADVVQNNGDYTFRLVAELEESGISLEELDSASTAEDLADAVAEEKMEGVTKLINDSGTVTFRDLSIGLYLLVQEDAADGYNQLAPFLVSLPGQKNGSYVYDVNASPKVELEPAPTTKPTTPSGTTTPGNLPQTGQDNWPVPVLLAFGLLFLVTGGWLCLSGKERKHEA